MILQDHKEIALEALGLNLGYLLVQLFSFLILVIILHAWVYKPLMDMLDRRRKMIAQGIEDARVAAEARENAEKDAEQILSEAKQEAGENIREARQRAETAALQIREQAKKEASEIRADAEESARRIKNEALKDLRGEVASLAVAAARQVISSSLDEEQQREMVQSFFSGLKDRKIVLLENEQLHPGPIEVTSALPLSDKEKNLVRSDLKRRLKIDPELEFSVDPAILGGLIIRVGDRVIDGSAVGQLEDLRSSL